VFEEGMLCPVCGDGRLIRVRKDVDFTFRSRTVVFKDCEMLVCTNVSSGCEGEFFDRPIELIIDDTLKAMRDSIIRNAA